MGQSIQLFFGHYPICFNAWPDEGSRADGDGDGDVDQDDYSVWRANFGKTLPAAANAASEFVQQPAALPVGVALPVHQMEFFVAAVERTTPPAKPGATARLAELLRSIDPAVGVHEAGLVAWLTSRSDGRGPEAVEAEAPERHSTGNNAEDVAFDALDVVFDALAVAFGALTDPASR